MHDELGQVTTSKPKRKESVILIQIQAFTLAEILSI